MKNIIHELVKKVIITYTQQVYEDDTFELYEDPTELLENIISVVCDDNTNDEVFHIIHKYWGWYDKMEEAQYEGDHSKMKLLLNENDFYIQLYGIQTFRDSKETESYQSLF